MGLVKFVPFRVISINFNFIDIEELMFVNVYLRLNFITLCVVKEALFPRHISLVNENPEIFTVVGSGYFAMIIL